MSIEKKDSIIISEKYKEEFFNNVSHELKTPLTIIIGYAQLLKEEKFSSEELYLRAVNNMECEGKKLNSIIDELIEKARQN
ncbi:MAG: histidine kinase dimerization/phospho-acceptor domain-containing protein [Vulcanibacillus sp.]